MPSVFLGDNLFTLGRNLTFLQDGDFMRAFDCAEPNRLERAIIWRKHILNWAARRALCQPGDFVEAACYTGFTARLICNALDLVAPGKRFWLYDLFEGPADPARQMAAHFAGDPVRVVQGRLPAALHCNMPERLALRHVDMNNVEAEIGTLDALWDRIVPGGTIILDDFGRAAYRDQTLAHLDWFAAPGGMVLGLPTGQGLVIKS